jgi:hypothetical protein
MATTAALPIAMKIAMIYESEVGNMISSVMRSLSITSLYYALIGFKRR